MLEKTIEIVLVIIGYIPKYRLKIPCTRRLINRIHYLFKTIRYNLIDRSSLSRQINNLVSVFIVILSILQAYKIIHVH